MTKRKASMRHVLSTNPYIRVSKDEHSDFCFSKVRELKASRKLTWIKLSNNSYTEGIYYKDNNSIVIYPSAEAGKCRPRDGMGPFVLLKNEATGNQKRIWSPNNSDIKEHGNELKACQAFMREFILANPVLHGKDSVNKSLDYEACCNRTTRRQCNEGWSLNKYRDIQPEIPSRVFDRDTWLPDSFYLPVYEWEKWKQENEPESYPYSFVGRITLENLVTRGSTLTNGLGSSLDSVKKISATLPLAKTSQESDTKMTLTQRRNNWRKIHRLQYWSE